MKKLFITALFAVAISVSSFANVTNVNLMVMNHFSADFRGAENVNWTVTSKFTKAVFELDDKKMEAFYSTNGEFMGVSTAIHFSKLPKKAIKNLAIQYRGRKELLCFISYRKGESDSSDKQLRRYFFF